MARLQTRATTLVLQIQQQIEESLASIIDDGVAYVYDCTCARPPRVTVPAASIKKYIFEKVELSGA